MSAPIQVPVARFHDYHEALVACSALQAAGVRPHLAENFHASVAWHYVIALQGIRILVPHSDFEIARAVLDGANHASDAPRGAANPRPTPTELILAGAAFLIAGLPFPLWLRRKRPQPETG